MKLGLLTDIHEHVENLRTALDRFRVEQVDQIVVIGDVFEMGHRVNETCQLLSDAKAIGVWGNHDYGLCVEPDAVDCEKYGDGVIRFMTSLRPRLEISGCYFTHVEPWLNPEEVADLWYFDGPPDEHGKLDRIFNAVPNRLMFAGHFHKWLLATPTGIENWNGETAIALTDERYFVVIGALCEGRFAILDTETSLLTPFNHPAV
jgi:hypothetical protein